MDIIVWDGVNPCTTFQSPVCRTWPFVFVGPDESICMSGMSSSTYQQTKDNCTSIPIWRFSQVTRHWTNGLYFTLPISAVPNALQVSRPSQDNNEPFSIFSFSTTTATADRYLHQIFLTEPRSSKPVSRPAPPRYIQSSVYDGTNDTIWALTNNDLLLGYDVKRETWHTHKLPTKLRGSWAQLCMSSCFNVLYVVGGCGPVATIVDELNIETKKWKTVDFRNIPVNIPTHLMSPLTVQIKDWNQHWPNVITVYDGELVYINRRRHINGLSEAENLVFRSIVTYNPNTHRRQLCTVLPTILDEFTPLVI